MKKLYFSLACILLPFLVFSQANSWIVYSQKYCKIKVAKDGVYRIDSATLATAVASTGYSLSAIDPRNFQLFFHGKEQYIYIKGQNDGVFNGPKSGGDYIEFYGQHNTGALISDAASDSLLYAGITAYPDSAISAVPNPYYSMFNDTSTYYLTWNTSLHNRRDSSYAVDTTFSLYTPLQYFTAQTVQSGNSSYKNFCAGARIAIAGSDEINDPRYTNATGWFLPQIGLGQTYTVSLTGVTNIYAGANAPAAVVKTFFEGQSVYGTSNDHEIRVSAPWASGNLTDTSFVGFGICVEKYNVSASKLAASAPSLSFYSVPLASISSVGNISAVGYVFAQYPHTTNMGGDSSYMMYIRDTTSSTKTYLDLSNLSVMANDTVRLYDLTTHNRYIVTQQAGYKVLMPNTTGINKQCFITSDAHVNKVTKLIPVGTNSNGTFTNYAASAPFSSAYIMIYHPSLSAEASVYRNYREKKYGANNVIYANVEELYDQFCYGIEKDPLAIRNFCSYVINNSVSKAPPSALFLVGKAIHSYMCRQDTSLNSSNLVPSFGYPSSDELLTAGLNSQLPKKCVAPGIPTGRLSATNNIEISNYLNKVEIYESNTPALWMKNIIHFAGGNPGWEHNSIMYYMGIDSADASNPFFGANVYTIQKTSTSPIQITFADSIADLINNGVSLMTFFGHASGTNFDINLDAPSDYNNYGKYPMILALACLSGDVYEPLGGASSSTSEQFVLDPKGSIGFIAMDALGVLDPLGNYSTLLYPDFSTTMYRKSIGSCLQSAAVAIQSNDPVTNSISMEMQLDGDPSIVINGNDSLPDYAVTDTSLTTIPGNVTTQVDSFKVRISVLNQAKAKAQTVQVEIDRTLPVNDSIVKRTITMNNIYYRRDTILTYPVDKVNGVGMNYFSIKVDPNKLDSEITKMNNDVSKIGVLITSGDIIPIYPYNFAIIPKDTATLKASTGDPFAPVHNYIFQVDTTIYFNSGFLKSQVINSKGGVVRAPWNKWVSTPFAPPIITSPTKGTVSLILKDSTVYYWRVRCDTSDIKDYGWQNSSFQYIKGKSGWGQSHYYQFDNNQYTYLQQNLSQRNWTFNPTGKTLKVTTVGLPLGPYLSTYEGGAFETGYYLDLISASANSCTPTPAFKLAVIDPVTLIPWSTQNYDLGNDNNAANAGTGCVYPDESFLYWYNDATAVGKLISVLSGNTIPKGDYIIMYSFRESMLKSAPYLLKNTLVTMLGADPNKVFKSNADSLPWIFITKKGDPSFPPQTLLGTNPNDTLRLKINLKNNNSYGSMVSPVIGPAQKWDSISWRQHPLVKNAHDSVRLNVMAIDNNGNSTILLKGVAPVVANMYITSLNPKQYPCLQFMLYTEDAVTHTPSQMNKWQVFYTPVPEVAVNPSIYYSFYKDTLYGGDTVRFKTVIQNVGDYAMDSMYANAWITNTNGASTYLSGIRRTKKLNPGDTTMISAKASSNAYTGSNNIWMEVNPPFLPQTRPEEYYFNNYVRKTFVSEASRNTPLLDVTFDGIHILNNDIVSPHPNILMELTSNNKFLVLNYSDTGKFAVYLRNVNSPNPQRIYFGSQMQFTPAVLPNNKCKVLYTPSLPDGTYELTVQAADQSGNLAAANSYKVDFVVVNKSTITNVLNYPNPFSASTRFVFTITGDQLPTYFKIQVMTITGKVVREITENELGPLHIGRNITQYAWDGTDQFGSKLANGVYLYKITTSIDNQSIDHMDTGADSYFTKGWGKMYIIR